VKGVQACVPTALVLLFSFGGFFNYARQGEEMLIGYLICLRFLVLSVH
jgi:hypothetical protein